MNREWGPCNMSYSCLNDSYRRTPYNQAHLQSRITAQSKEKSLDHSRDRKINSYQQLGNTIRNNTYRAPESVSLKEIPHHDSKDQVLQKQMETVIKRVRELEGKMMESEHRVKTLELGQKNTAQLRSAIEEFMRNHYAEIQDRDSLKERIDALERDLRQLSALKADKKELESIEIGRYYGLTERCNDLQRQSEQASQSIVELNGKYQKMISKIESSFQATNEQYICLFESNVIKTIEQVNRLTEQLQKMGKQSNQKYDGFSLKIQELQKELSKNAEKENLIPIKKTFSSELIGVSLPNLRLVQSVSVREEKKKHGLTNFKEHIKEQHKETLPLSQSAGSTSSSTFNSETVTSTMNDSLDPSTTEVFLEKVVYKLDKDFNLLDENDYYVLDAANEHIRLNMGQMAILKEHGLLA